MAKSKVTSIRASGQAPLAARPLPVEARHKLGTLVTEVRGASRLLYFDGVARTEDMAAALGFWLERIAHDLETMECREYPAVPERDA